MPNPNNTQTVTPKNEKEVTLNKFWEFIKNKIGILKQQNIEKIPEQKQEIKSDNSQNKNRSSNLRMISTFSPNRRSVLIENGGKLV